MMRSKQPMAETEIFEDTEEQFRRRGGEAPRDVMPEDLMPKRPMPKRKMRMPPEKVMSKVPVKKMGGGKVKSYANGGSVKGAGAAQRGVRPCKYV